MEDVEDGGHHLSPTLSAILNGREGGEGWSAIVAGHASSMGSGVLSLRPRPGSCRLWRQTGGIARPSRNPRLIAGILSGCPEGILNLKGSLRDAAERRAPGQSGVLVLETRWTAEICMVLSTALHMS